MDNERWLKWAMLDHDHHRDYAISGELRRRAIRQNHGIADPDETGHPPAPSTVPHEDSGSGDENALPGAHRVNRGVGGTVPERDED